MKLVVEAIGGGAIGGVVAGGLAALIVTVAVPRKLTSSSWLQVVPVAAAALAYGLRSALDGSGFIAAFVGGIVYGALHPSTGGEASYLIEELGELTNAITFLVFGAVFVGPMLGRPHVVGRPLRAAQPDGRANDPGRDRARRNASTPADHGVRRLVRPAGPRLDRLHRDHPRRDGRSSIRA